MDSYSDPHGEISQQFEGGALIPAVTKDTHDMHVEGEGLDATLSGRASMTRQTPADLQHFYNENFCRRIQSIWPRSGP